MFGLFRVSCVKVRADLNIESQGQNTGRNAVSGLFFIVILRICPIKRQNAPTMRFNVRTGILSTCHRKTPHRAK